MGRCREGVLAIGDSMNEVLEEAERLGFDRGEIVVEFLDTAPPVLILWQSANQTVRNSRRLIGLGPV